MKKRIVTNLIIQGGKEREVLWECKKGTTTVCL